MIRSFRNEGTADVFAGRDTRAARAVCPRDIWAIAQRKLDQLDWATTLESLSRPRGNRLEALKADRAGQHAIRINRRYRVCFVWGSQGPEHVEVVDYH